MKAFFPIAFVHLVSIIPPRRPYAYPLPPRLMTKKVTIGD